MTGESGGVAVRRSRPVAEGGDDAFGVEAAAGTENIAKGAFGVVAGHFVAKGRRTSAETDSEAVGRGIKALQTTRTDAGGSWPWGAVTVQRSGGTFHKAPKEQCRAVVQECANPFADSARGILPTSSAQDAAPPEAEETPSGGAASNRARREEK